MNCKLPALPLLVAVALLSDAAALDLSRYPFVRDVETISAREEFVAVTLDRSIWDAANNEGGPDICIATEGETPVPHLFRKAGERRFRTVRDRRGSSISGLTEHADNRISFFIDLENNTEDANLIEFVTPLKDFERQITVYGIRPDGAEFPLVENVLVYDYTRFADVRHVIVALPSNTFRRFRVEVRDVTDEAQSPRREISRTFEQDAETQRTEHSVVTTRSFRMDAVRLWNEHEAETYTVERKIVLPLKSWQVREDIRQKQTVIDIETFNEPLSSLSLQLSARNFSRRVTVEIPVREGTATETWRSIASATLSRISFRDFRREDLTVSFPEQQARRLRIVIANNDNPPLEIAGVETMGPVWQALFIAEPGLRLRLYDGAPQPRFIRQDTEPIERIIVGGDEPVTFLTGTPAENPLFRKPIRSWSGLLGSRLFFIVAIAIMAAVLATALVRATKKLNLPPTDPS